ncbi:hypothetical protein DT070_05150 [Polaromonas sp. SP1]|nr:hypothetical protein DT070_05150 [Polaromonas sp. SP1]
MIGSVWAVSAWMVTKGFDLKQGEIISYAILPAIGCLLLSGLVAAHTRAVSNVYGLCAILLMDRQTSIASKAQADSKRRPSRVR